MSYFCLYLLNLLYSKNITEYLWFGDDLLWAQYKKVQTVFTNNFNIVEIAGTCPGSQPGVSTDSKAQNQTSYGKMERGKSLVICK